MGESNILDTVQKTDDILNFYKVFPEIVNSVSRQSLGFPLTEWKIQKS